MKPVALLHRLWQATVGRSEFLRFSIVGGIGFVVDAGIVTVLVRGLGMDPYAGRVLSFLAGATTTWYLNRTFTFANGRSAGSRGRQWLRFVAVNSGGALINYGVYVLTLELWPLARHYPAIGVAFGSIAGLAFNYPASKFLVFRRPAGEA